MSICQHRKMNAKKWWIDPNWHWQSWLYFMACKTSPISGNNLGYDKTRTHTDDAIMFFMAVTGRRSVDGGSLVIHQKSRRSQNTKQARYSFYKEANALLWFRSKKPNMAMSSSGSYCLHLVASFSINRLFLNRSLQPLSYNEKD